MISISSNTEYIDMPCHFCNKLYRFKTSHHYDVQCDFCATDNNLYGVNSYYGVNILLAALIYVTNASYFYMNFIQNTAHLKHLTSTIPTVMNITPSNAHKMLKLYASFQ